MITDASLYDTPGPVVVHGHNIRSEALRHPLDVFLVFLGVEGAGGVDEQPSGFECIPDIHENSPLPLRTFAHRRQAPLVARLLILAEHSFSGARCIHQNTIEQVGAQLAVLGGCVVGDHGVAVAPFLDVLAEDKDPLANDLVAEEQSVASEIFADERAFASRRSAEVQHYRRGVKILLEYLLYEHRTCLLHVVATGVEERVQRELRTFGEIISVHMPRHLVGVAVKSQHIQFGIEANRGHGVCLQSPQQQLRLHAHLLAHTIYEINRQHNRVQSYCFFLI